MAIQVPRFSNCCFCFSLRTGSLIIGYVSIITSLFFMSIISYLLYVVVAFVKANKNQPNPEHSPEELQRVAIGVYVSHASYLLVFLILAAISIMMVVGVHANKPRLLRYYVYSGSCLLLMEMILIVISFVFVGFFASLPVLKWCVTHLLCLMVVRSLYLDMEDQNKPKTYEMQNLYSPPAPVNFS